MNGSSVKFASTSSLQSSSNSMSFSNVTSNDINEVCQSVPPELTRLIRIVVRKFYGFELSLCMEMFMIYPCIKEEDLAELLRLDLKVVHQHLINLKKEKFLSERSLMETNADGKSTKHSYFYIDYKMMVNIIKYKLDNIRQKNCFK
jgi:transcription initiation factor TFIIE subunit alpha